MAEADTLTNKERVIRYLKTGTEGNFYLPGRNKTYRYLNNVIRDMFMDGQGVEVVDCIRQVHAGKLYFKREPLLYYLAEATHVSNQETKRAAYAIVNDVCENPRDFFIWLNQVKVFSQLTKGWGKGLRKVVSHWYNSRDPMQIAEFVTRFTHVGRWSHKDVFRLSHIKPENDGLAFIVKAVCKGFKVAKDSTPEPSAEVQKIIAHFEAVDFVKTNSDALAVAMKYEECNLHREHIPPVMLKSKEVWNSLLRNMTVEEVITSLPALGRRAFLTAGGSDPILKQIQATAVSRVLDTDAIAKEGIDPYFVYIAIRNYVRVFAEVRRHAGQGQKREAPPTKPEAADDQPKKKKKKKKNKDKEGGAGEREKSAEEQEDIRVMEKAKKNNPEIYEALHKAFRVAVEKNLPSTNKRWLIAIKATSTEFQKGIRGIPSMTALEVMAVTAMLMKKREEKCVDLGFFMASLTPMKYPSELEEIIQEIAQAAVPDLTLACDPAAPITWALEKKKAYDVILVMSDGHETHGETCPADTLLEYRREMNLPDTKMILCGLAAPRLDFAKAPGMLDMGGFDTTVPKIIHEFVTGKLDTL